MKNLLSGAASVVGTNKVMTEWVSAGANDGGSFYVMNFNIVVNSKNRLGKLQINVEGKKSGHSPYSR